MFTRRRPPNIPEIVKEKWSEGVAEEGFVPFPKKLLRCLGEVFHEIEDLRVVLAVVDYKRPGLTRPPSFDFLAFVAGMDVGDFKGRVARMEEKGWLTTDGPDVAVDIRLNGLVQKIMMTAKAQEQAERMASDEDGGTPRDA